MTRLLAWLIREDPIIDTDWIIQEDTPGRLGTIQTRVNASLVQRVLTHPDRALCLKTRAPLPGKATRELPDYVCPDLWAS